MHLYHCFEKTKGPFLRLPALPSKEADTIQQYICQAAEQNQTLEKDST